MPCFESCGVPKDENGASTAAPGLEERPKQKMVLNIPHVKQYSVYVFRMEKQAREYRAQIDSWCESVIRCSVVAQSVLN
jgi:hypothetical protein